MDIYHYLDKKIQKYPFPIASLNAAYEVVTQRDHHVRNFSPMASDTKEKQLCALSVDELKKCFELTLRGLDQTIAFFDDNDIARPKRIDHITYIVGLFVHNRNRDLSENQIEALIEWYKKADFTNKSNDQRRDMFIDIIKLRHLADNKSTEMGNGVNTIMK